MKNPTGTDIPDVKYTLNDVGYKQAIANSAYILYSQAMNLHADYLRGETTELSRIVDEIPKLANNEEIVNETDHTKLVMRIVHEVFPEIIETFKVPHQDVFRDVLTVFDYYSAQTIINNLKP